MVRTVHRSLSLAVALIWLVQAITGTLSVFRWEIDDRTVAGAAVPLDVAALGKAVDKMDDAPDTSVSSVWTSGTSANRLDIHYSVGDAGRVARVDGLGRPLRDRSTEQLSSDGAYWDTIHTIHTSLMAGDAGKWLIGLSGILLITNIGLGLKLAWPKRGTLRKTLFGIPAGGGPARLYGWHRKLGLWFAIPALFTVTAGVMLVFVDGVERTLKAELSEPVVPPSANSGRVIGLSAALRVASDTFPDSSFSGVSLPGEDSPWYKVRVRNAGELPRKWGTTVIYVAASDGRVLGTYDAARPRAARAVIDTLYALHTGQAGGSAGRVVVLIIGLLLMGLIGLGMPLWWTRRRVKAARRRGRRPQARSDALGPSLD